MKGQQEDEACKAKQTLEESIRGRFGGEGAKLMRKGQGVQLGLSLAQARYGRIGAGIVRIRVKVERDELWAGRAFSRRRGEAGRWQGSSEEERQLHV
jgi:hypothetical protein